VNAPRSVPTRDELLIRIISARRATPHERVQYEGGPPIMKDEYDFSKATRRTDRHPTKEKISIRIDADVLAWFRDRVSKTGGNYQSDINAALQRHIAEHDNAARPTSKQFVTEARVQEIIAESERPKKGASGW